MYRVSGLAMAPLDSYKRHLSKFMVFLRQIIFAITCRLGASSEITKLFTFNTFMG